MADRDRLRRALLFMPGDDLHKISKGAALGVDAIIMDLEDGVAVSSKEVARQTVVQALTSAQIDFGRTERLVRLNPAASGLQGDDLTQTFVGPPDGYVVPKVESAVEIADLCARLSALERAANIAPGTIGVIALIETARGVVNLREIAGSDPRLMGLAFGAEDLAAGMGAIRTAEGGEVAYARSAVVIHAAAFGLQALDSPYVTLDDSDGLRRETQLSMQMGYTGKLAIHPAQVETILAVYRPSDEEIERARQLIAAHESHQAEGSGVFAFEGRMVDMPMLRGAQRIMARADRERG
jgi:citrate lyase beta subunit